jgi:Rrf2 family protein
MKTTSKARYSLYLVTDIAKHQAVGPVPLREVGIRQNISLKYLEQLASELVKEGFLQSVRGAAGGYLLARSAEDITAGDIMRAAEGGFFPVSCLIDDGETCPRQGDCSGPARFWLGLQQTIDTYIDNITIAQLI